MSVTTRPSVKTTKVVQVVADNGAGSNNTHNNYEGWHQQIDGIYDMQPKSVREVETRPIGRALWNSNPVTRTPDKAIKYQPLQPGIGPDYAIDLSSQGPLVLSPTAKSSGASASSAGMDMWDSPRTPSQCPDKMSMIGVWTPFTLPTTHDVSAEQTPAPEATKIPPKKAGKSTAPIDTAISCTSDLGEKKHQKKALQGDVYFQPKKLIRNMTKELQAITDANRVAAEWNYLLKPEFDSENVGESTSPTLSHQSRVETQCNSEDNVKVQVKVERTALKVAFPISPQTRALRKKLQNLEHIVPFKIHSRLKEAPHRCVASLISKPLQRCFSKCPSGGTDTIFRGLLECTIDNNCHDFLEHVNSLVKAAMCGPHRNAALSGVKIGILKELASDPSYLSYEGPLGLRAWANAISNRNLPSSAQDCTDQVLRLNGKHTTNGIRNAPSKAESPSIVTERVTPVQPTLSYTPVFSSYQPTWSKGLSISSALRKIITMPLKRMDLKDGFMYIFWDEEYIGRVKIGFTSDPEQRLKDWNRRCQNAHIYHLSSKRKLTKIPHMGRIELLMHTELKEVRKKRTCEGCKTTHNEWFEMPEALALKVFQKWQQWIIQEPYAFDVATGKWIIRPEMEHTLEDICQPVLPDPRPQKAPSRSKAGTKK